MYYVCSPELGEEIKNIYTFYTALILDVLLLIFGLEVAQFVA